ncbi:RES family NAD+ phosphorylase [Rahnella sp. L72c]|uniref:RES family NAD+ phosphorylase n=1 Tax=Rahnella perminowiae TaxID=2816244 RepID=A0ABS6KW97_9GAMM|nr:RES family NAD+ phosphorylase [Rahnella perminowiae]MBU9833295.1 RES family NAD+ phosphorylase [Rahnella perminowiae]
MGKHLDILKVPNGEIKINNFTINVGTRLFRVHPSIYNGTIFNPSNLGDARFSPIKKLGTNHIIPTMYAGFDSNVALSETIFRDLDINKKEIKIYVDDFKDSNHTELETCQDLNLATLDVSSLVKMRVSRQLIQCSPEFYEITREWAEHLHNQHPNIMGLVWPSRQHTGNAIILFGDRVESSSLKLIDTASVMQKKYRILIASLANKLDVVIDSRDNLNSGLL